MPTTKVTYEVWVAEAVQLLWDGHGPADDPNLLTIDSLAKRLHVTKGSFYAHFPAGIGQLEVALIDRWVKETRLPALNTALQAVRTPADRLRLLWAQFADTVKRDGAMRRWAARDEQAAAAVGNVDKQVSQHVREALKDMGLTAADAGTQAGVLVSAFAGAYHAAPDPPPPDASLLEKELAFLIRAARRRAPAVLPGGEQEVLVAQGASPDVALLLTAAKGLPPERIGELVEQARRFEVEVAGGPSRAPARRPRAAARRRASP